jgi:hypothetical protein
MSDMLDPKQLVAVLMRLQATAEDARREQMVMRSVFDAMGATSNAHSNEMTVRLSNIEMAQLRLTERIEDVAARVDRILMMLGG